MAIGSIPLTAHYGVFECQRCSTEHPDECADDLCTLPWADELSATDYWPTCRCCGREAQLVTPLVPYDARPLS
jgi:hypothetical protein